MTTQTATRKATKAAALACYDGFHGVRRLFNGGTVEENLANSSRCIFEMRTLAKEAARLASNPSKHLANDAWLMGALTESIPNTLAAMETRYPKSA